MTDMEVDRVADVKVDLGADMVAVIGLVDGNFKCSGGLKTNGGDDDVHGAAFLPIWRWTQWLTQR